MKKKFILLSFLILGFLSSYAKNTKLTINRINTSTYEASINNTIKTKKPLPVYNRLYMCTITVMNPDLSSTTYIGFGSTADAALANAVSKIPN